MVVKVAICIFIIVMFSISGFCLYYELNKPKEQTYEEKMRALGLEPFDACPKCNSLNIRFLVEKEHHPAITKDEYNINLNPLKPLTVLEKNTKVVQKEYTTSHTTWQCQDCGALFKNPLKRYLKKK